jgi:hypothetical protein
VLLNMRHSEIYSRHFNNMYFVYLRDDFVDQRERWRREDAESKWRDGDKACEPTTAPQAAVSIRSTYQSVLYVLNYYEFIAVGVRTGALDAAIIRRTISPHMHTFFDRFRSWIDADRADLRTSKPYEHLEWFVEKFPRAPVLNWAAILAAPGVHTHQAA